MKSFKAAEGYPTPIECQQKLSNICIKDFNVCDDVFCTSRRHKWAVDPIIVLSKLKFQTNKYTTDTLLQSDTVAVGESVFCSILSSRNYFYI